MNRDHDHPSLDKYRCSLCLRMRFALFGVEICPTCDSLGRWPNMAQAMEAWPVAGEDA